MGKLDFYEAEDRPWPNPRLQTASIVGHTTTTTSKIWVRVVAEGEHHLYVGKQPVDSAARPRPVSSGLQLEARGQTHALEGRIDKHSFTFETDLTHVFEVKELSPGETYHYAVFRDADHKPWEMGAVDALSFRTPAKDPDEVNFGIFSCHMPYKDDKLKDVSLWDALRQELHESRAAYVIGMGDQVYVDGTPKLDIWRWLRKVKRDKPTPEDMRSWYRDIYRGYWGIREVREVFRAFPTYMIWDDHEIKDGWGSYTEDELASELDRFFEWNDGQANVTLARRMWEAAKQVYGEYEHGHNPDTKAGVWHYEFGVGRCATFVLDMRGHRAYRAKGDSQILGAAQIQDLRDWLGRLDATTEVAFVVSPVPLVHVRTGIVNSTLVQMLNPAGLTDDLRDQWEHASNHAERRQVLDALFDWSQRTRRRVVVLSGDVHVGAAFRLSDPERPDARVHQVTSSGISYASTTPAAELVASTTGNVAGATDIVFTRALDPFTRNNFAIVRVKFAKQPGDDASVSVNFFGLDPSGEGVVKLRRLEL